VPVKNFEPSKPWNGLLLVDRRLAGAAGFRVVGKGPAELIGDAQVAHVNAILAGEES
jgi:hypothetical protein